MADNKDEENLETPKSPKSENSPDEIIPAKNAETFNPNQETENMEVHHHAHHEGKKNWKSYFWEFLMLFLAVFCGFLAEYQLEHKIEKDRVTKYMHDMVQNLKYDTTRVSVNLPTNRNTKQELDTFRIEIKQAIAGEVHLNRLYYFSLKTNDISIVAFNRASITQLKNSGQLRLVKNDSLVSEMLDYYERRLSCQNLERYRCSGRCHNQC